jgi:translation elongation factor EF-Ts
MMEYKKSLQLYGKHFKKAIEWLRFQGAAKVSSKLECREVTERNGIFGFEPSVDATS